MGSDNEDDETNNTDTPSVQDQDVELCKAFLDIKLKHVHGHGYDFRKPQKHQDCMCTATRGVVMLALVLLFFGIGYVTGIFTPYKLKQYFIHKHPNVTREPKTKPWHTKLTDWGEFGLVNTYCSCPNSKRKMYTVRTFSPQVCVCKIINLL